MKTSQAVPHWTAHTIGCKNNIIIETVTWRYPIPENKRQYCFTRPLKLEVHVKYWTTALRIILPFKTFKDQKSAEQIRRQFSQNWESLRGKSIVNCGQFSRDQYLTLTSNFSGLTKTILPFVFRDGALLCHHFYCFLSQLCEPFSEVLLDCLKGLSEGVYCRTL